MNRPLLTLLFTLLAPACFANQGGHLAARRGPAKGAAPALRRDARSPLVAACGDGDVLADSVRRAPYLQRLDRQGTRVLWTSTSSAPATVIVTTPEGRRVTSAVALEDHQVRPPRGRQMIARIDRLEPDTIYCYEIRERDRRVVGRAGFRTAPAAGSGAPVRFVAWGDSGSGNGDQHALLRQIPTVPFDLMLHTGDVAYPVGSLKSLERTFFDVYRPLLRHFVDYPVAGNHEYKTRGAAPFRDVFDLPGNERWYSFDWGDVHFVAIDTERLGPEQAGWLDRDLEANRLPWTVVFMHKPPYSSGQHGSDAGSRAWIHPILKKHQVPLVLAGHEHNYERTKAVDGVTYVVTGGGGKGTRPVGTSSFTAYSDDVIHFVYVTVEGDRLRLHAIDAKGIEFDSVEIGRPGAERQVARTNAP